MSLSTLTNTEWLVGATPDFTAITETVEFAVNFKSNGEFFSSLSVVVETIEGEDDEEDTVTKTLTYGSKAIYDGTEDFPAEYRKIQFIDGTDIDDSDLITFVETYATRTDITDNFRVIRKTLTGSSQEYDFGNPGMQFLVKNLSDGDVYVNFEDITNDNTAASALIPKETAQVIVTNTGYPKKEFAQIYVKGAGTGDVEIQMILW